MTKNTIIITTITTITYSTLYYHGIYNRIQNWCIIWLKETLAIITLIIAPNGKNFIAMQVSIAHDLLHVGRVCSINIRVLVLALVSGGVALARPVFVVRVSVVIALVAISRLVIVISSTAILVSAIVVAVVTAISHYIVIIVAASSHVVVSVHLWTACVVIVRYERCSCSARVVT